MSRDVEIIFGPPGTGKTTELLKRLSQYLESGGSPERVAFVSFSRRAIKEVAEKLGKDLDEFPYFRTIHSLAYHFMGLKRDDVFQSKHWKVFSEIVGLPFTAAGYEEPLWDGTTGDKCMALYDLSRARGTTLEREWQHAMLPSLTMNSIHSVVKSYERFKDVNGLVDFHDMILKAEGELPVDLLIVDEAQDCSRAQWTFLRKVARNVERIILAGDDDQAVYAWSGADAGALQRFEGRFTVLPQSYRLPAEIKRMADGISSRIQSRVGKVFGAKTDRATGAVVCGEVTWRRDADTLDLHDGRRWLLIARSNYQLEGYRDMARRQGVVYTLPDGHWSWTIPAVQAAITYETLRKGEEVPRARVRDMMQYAEQAPGKLPPVVVWSHLFGEAAMEIPWYEGLPRIGASDREYIRALRQAGESTHKPGRVRIGTVHSVKGAEAENVVLRADISERVAHGRRIDPDSEHRVQYVGVTRASERLHLILPSTAHYWAF